MENKESVFGEGNEFFKSVELNQESGKMDLIKGRISMPVGTIRSGMIKVAAGNWMPVKKKDGRDNVKEKEIKAKKDKKMSLDDWAQNAAGKIKDAIADGKLDEDNINSKNISGIVDKTFTGAKFSDKEINTITEKVKAIMKIK